MMRISEGGDAVRRALVLLVSAILTFSCGAQPGAQPAPTPAPELKGALLRLRAAMFGQPVTRAIIASNASPTRTAGFNISLQDPLANHTTRRELEARQLKSASSFKPRFALKQVRTLGEIETFWVFTDDTPGSQREQQVHAYLSAIGQHCYVWLDTTDLSPHLESLGAQRAKEIAEAFDNRIYPTDTRLFGSEPNPGIDGESRIHIVITPAVSQGGAGTTLGYFTRRDEYPRLPNGSDAQKHSNEKEMISIARRIVLTGTAEDFLGTLAHELQHMINFNQKVLVGKNLLGEDLWLDEGLSMYALEANGYGLKGGGRVLFNHVRDFQDQPEAYSLNDWNGNPHGIGYGAVYLFLVYLVDRFGEGILRDLVMGVEVGFPNLERQLGLRGASFADFFADWVAANLVDHVAGMPSRLSYKQLQMRGVYGGRVLPGFSGNEVSEQALLSYALRPCSFIYAWLTENVGLPRFTVPDGVTVDPPLHPE